ncbi:O-antigen ligase family protein [Thiomicrorhabdus cannonii]|uniref:O-antigen ligase family protein n=1 Tax=Thiomicrorhabdus cannonii TaxID=2748011 RepID=UPI0015B9FA5C|nr:O-antigen ligase family protein [Thiomicrorhabdus cannonii]
MDTKVLESTKLNKFDLLRIFIIGMAGWSLILTKLMPLETTLLVLAILAIVVFKRPIKEAFPVPNTLFIVVVVIFVSLGILPVVFYWPLGESSFNLIDHKLSALVALAFIWIVFWQLKPTEDVIWWSMMLITLSVAVVIGYELYVLGTPEAIFTHRFGSLATPYVIRFGIYSNLLTVILLGGFIWAASKGPWVIFWLLMAALLSFVGSLVSDTRTAWAGLPEALIAWSLFYWLYIKRNGVVNVRRVLNFWFLFVISFSAILFYFGDRVEQRWNAMTGDLYNYAEGTGSAGSVGTRLVLFQAGIQGFLEKPWTGVGEDNSISEQLRLTAPIMNEIYGQNKGVAFGHLHNQFIDDAFTRGIIGLASLLITIVYLIWFFGCKVKLSKQNGSFSPWPLAGLLFVISSSISMLAEAWIHLSTGVIFYIFFISLFVFLSKDEARFTV